MSKPIPRIVMSGGLGNQLFQLALGLSRLGVPGKDFVLDESGLSQAKVQRDNELRRLLPKESFINSNSKVHRVLDFSRKHAPLFFQLLSGFAAKTTNQLIDQMRSGIQIETKKLFDPHIDTSDALEFRGTFFHPSYWRTDPEVIFGRIFIYFKRYFDEYEIQMEKQPVLGMHIRRGDYLLDKKTRDFHGYCGIDFYLEALEKIDDLDIFQNIFLFTDAKNAKRYIPILFPKHQSLVVVDKSKNSLALLRQMISCNTLIGCNSSLSWWASYLGPEKVRVLPLNWFLDKNISLEPRNVFFPKPTILQKNMLKSEKEQL